MLGFNTNPDQTQALAAVQHLASTIVQMDSTNATEEEVQAFLTDMEIEDPRA